MDRTLARAALIRRVAGLIGVGFDVVGVTQAERGGV